jgi:hypothetical protein
MLLRLFRRGSRPPLSRAQRPPRFRPGLERLDERWLPSIVVTNTNDTGPGSLRQAILDSNASVGVVDTIAFNVPGTGAHVIQPHTPLPALADPVFVDGYTQPGSAMATATSRATLQVVLDGSMIAGDADGLFIATSGSTVQGLAIGGFTLRDISISGDGNVVQGNYIGTDLTGTVRAPRPPGSNTTWVFDGVQIDGQNNTIGGTAPGARNVISGNRIGVAVYPEGSGNVVQGNFIGTDASGTLPLGNGTGVSIWGQNSTIGGTALGAGNLISANSGEGVVVQDGTGNAILSNLIFTNGGLGIDLGGDGVTPNDTGDSDTGPNNLQNFPVLSSATNAGSSLTVAGSLDSTPGTTFLLQFFASRTPDPSGYGEAETYLGSATVATGSANTVGFSVPLGVTVPAGQFITATATTLVDDDNNPATPRVPRDTSEFSHTVAVLGSITGRVFVDLNADGVQQPGEPGLKGRTLYLDLNNNGVQDTGEPTAPTDAFGNYSFSGLAPGTYVVRDRLLPGWYLSVPAAGSYTVASAGQMVTGRDFGEYQLASIAGHVFHDVNGDGIQESGEASLAQWTVYVDVNGNGRFDPGPDKTHPLEPYALTDANGNYLITGVRPGTDVVRVYLPAGWVATRPVGGAYHLAVTSGQARTKVDFGVARAVSIYGQVFWDTNANHVRDAGEPGQAGWVVYLDANNNGVLDPGEVTAATDSTGHYVFAGLSPGTYVVREVIPTPMFQRVWVQSLPTAGFYTVSLTEGLSAGGLDFGNVALYLGP